MVKNIFNEANEIKALRDTLNGFFGEIVTAVVGKDALQKLYEDAAKNDELPEGALQGKLGIIPADLPRVHVAKGAQKNDRKHGQ